jgi:TonB family protein
MAHHPTGRPDFAKSVQSDPFRPQAPDADSQAEVSRGKDFIASPRDLDFADVAAKFSAHTGGHLPADLSGELALDIVLNEIVEQACTATRATGAAIALSREGEMVCRASSGGSAPELGTRLDMNSGLSGACLRSRQIQICHDALSNPSADAEVSRQLGVRSVVVLPLLKADELIGIFEVFSTLPAAFGDHDLRTLQVLSDRILRNARARESSLNPISPSTSTTPSSGERRTEEGSSKQSVTPASESDERPFHDSVARPRSSNATESGNAIVPSFDWLSTFMGAIILAVAILMVTVVGMHLGWLRLGPRVTRSAAPAPTSSAFQASGNGQTPAAAPIPGPSTSASSNSASSGSASVQNKNTSAAQTAPRVDHAQLPEGGLRVFENGREVFRMTPSATGSVAKSANAPLQSAKTVELSSDAVESNLIKRVEPDYPEQALTQRIQGLVVLDVHIAQDGAVQEVRLQSGSPLLAESAMQAVRQWRFKTQKVNGRPVEMQTRVVLRFTLPPV